VYNGHINQHKEISMGTPALIGMQNPDGTIIFTSVNYDGHVRTVGRILHQHYQSIDKVEQLIGMGDVSVLGHEIGVKHNFNDRARASNGDSLYTTFYGRDRGDKQMIYHIAHNYADYVDGPGCDYVYLFASVDNNPYEWYLCTLNSHNREAVKLAGIFANTVNM
jgi:hypothetical protein